MTLAKRIFIDAFWKELMSDKMISESTYGVAPMLAWAVVALEAAMNSIGIEFINLPAIIKRIFSFKESGFSKTNVWHSLHAYFPDGRLMHSYMTNMLSSEAHELAALIVSVFLFASVYFFLKKHRMRTRS